MSGYKFQALMVASVLYLLSRFCFRCVCWVILSEICMFNTGMGRQARLLNLYIVCTVRIHAYFLIVRNKYIVLWKTQSSAYLLVCKLSNYHQCKKTKQFLSYRRKLPFTLETSTQSLRRKIKECQSINTLYDMLCYLTQLLMWCVSSFRRA